MEGVSMTEHTPTPWYVSKEVSSFSSIRGEDMTIVATRHRLPRNIHEANMIFIVEAVNNHEAMKARVDELEKALGEIAHMDEFLDSDSAKWMMNIACKALHGKGSAND